MKNFWKVLGIAALAVGLTPYKVEKDEETGENRYQALLWQATRVKKEMGEDKGEINITLGFNSPFQQEEEAHLFSDELSVEYSSGDLLDAVEDAAEKAADVAEDVADAAGDVAEKAADGLEDAAEKAGELAEKAAEAVEEAIEE